MRGGGNVFDPTAWRERDGRHGNFALGGKLFCVFSGGRLALIYINLVTRYPSISLELRNSVEGFRARLDTRRSVN